jgi:hypothetical protein
MTPPGMIGKPHCRYEYSKECIFGNMRACLIWDGKILAFGYCRVHADMPWGRLLVAKLLRNARHRKRSASRAIRTKEQEKRFHGPATKDTPSFPHLIDIASLNPTLDEYALKMPKTMESVIIWRSLKNHLNPTPNAHMASSGEVCHPSIRKQCKAAIEQQIKRLIRPKWPRATVHMGK